MPVIARLSALVLAGVIATLPLSAQEGFRFTSGVELVNVTATVTGRDRRFLTGLTREDFTIYDNGEPQEITHFSSERVPVSLGIVLDASGSMADDKMQSARAAINRFVTELLGPDDEIFFMHFNEQAILGQDWTQDRRAIARAVARVNPLGGTGLYDAIADALPIAATGRHTKKAVLVISDGNDSDSRIQVGELRQAIRESEVLVYALGIDGPGRGTSRTQQRQPPPPPPSPFPGRGRRLPPFLPQILGGWSSSPSSDRVNADALRQITDDTGGRTEIIRQVRDLDPATARIADELSRQYALAYSSPGLRDGRWHEIRVEVSDRSATVRARKGYISS